MGIRKPFEKKHGKTPKPPSGAKPIRNITRIREIADSLSANIGLKVDVKNWNDKADIRRAFKEALEPLSLMLHRDQRMRILSDVERLLND